MGSGGEGSHVYHVFYPMHGSEAKVGGRGGGRGVEILGTYKVVDST